MTLLAWSAPVVDYHGLAPEIVVAVGLCAVLLADLFVTERRKWILSILTSTTLLAALVPVLTLALSDDAAREMFDGRYVVDQIGRAHV